MEATRQPRETSNPGPAASEPSTLISISVVSPGDNQRFELPAVPLSMTLAAIAEQMVSEGFLPQPPTGQRYQLAMLGPNGLLHLDETQPLSAHGVEPGTTFRATTTTPGAAL